MICVDTSSFIAFIQGDHGKDVLEVEKALLTSQVVIAPPIITELLSDPKLDDEKIKQLGLIPVLPLKEGFWSRAGLLRAKLLKQGLKANLADTLISQACIDHNIPLITRDEDFVSFAKHSRLQLI